MLLLGYPITLPPPSNLLGEFSKSPFQSPSPVLHAPNLKSEFCATKASLRCSCIKNQAPFGSFERFSVLEQEIPWSRGSIWNTMGFYFFSLHIPLSFGSLSVVAQVLHQPVLDFKTETVSILVAQVLELIGALLLLSCTAKPSFKLLSLFSNKSEQRSSLITAAVGYTFLISVVFLTSLLADVVVGPKSVNNPIIKDLITSGDSSLIACIIVYCIVTPLLEELVYRGFLLTSLASKMEWHKAVVISSAVFSAAHFSGENAVQLFVIGCVLGCSYCWSGNLTSPTVIHSLYNAMVLLFTVIS